MTEYKGTAIVFLRTLMAQQPDPMRQAFERSISPDDLRVFRSTLSVSMVPIEVATRLYVAACAVIYSHEPADVGLRKLGRALATDNLSGIYRLVLKVLSVRMLIEHSPRLWRTYHNSGDVRAQSLGPTHYQLIVTGSPDLPDAYREFVCGYVEGATEITGGKNPRVSKSGTPQEWRWDVTWT